MIINPFDDKYNPLPLILEELGTYKGSDPILLNDYLVEFIIAIFSFSNIICETKQDVETCLEILADMNLIDSIYREFEDQDYYATYIKKRI